MNHGGGESSPPRPVIATLVLAAGRSSRMGDAHKLLEPVAGRPVVEWSVEAAIRSDLGPVVVVTGHCGDDVEARLPAGVATVRNAAWADGMAGSLNAGLRAFPPGVDAVAVALADMPAVRPSDYLRLASAWRPDRIVLPVHAGHRGHPVLWPSTLLGEFAELQGDSGAKPLLARHADAVDEVPVDHPGVVLDVDDAEGLLRADRVLRRYHGSPSGRPLDASPESQNGSDG